MNKTVITWAFAFILVGISICAHKYLALGFPLTSDESSKLWTVEASVEYKAKAKPVKAELRLPTKRGSHEIIEENLIAPRYGSSIKVDNKGRKAIWTKQIATGTQRLYYRAVIKDRKRDDLPKAAVERATSLLNDEMAFAAAQALIFDARSRSADDESFVLELLKNFNNPETNQNLQAIIGVTNSRYSLARLIVALLNLEGIPANIASGFELEDEKPDAQLITWVEVFYNQQWQLFNPRGYSLNNAENHILWWRGESNPVSIDGGDFKNVTFSVYADQTPRLLEAVNNLKDKNPLFYKLSLFSLPVHTQAVYKVLLLLPLGVLVVVFMRSVVGLYSFGNFIPVLIAMSFRETQLVWGLILFLVITAVGLVARLLLERLSLLTSARLGIVVTAVIFGMLFLSFALEELNLAAGLSVALFPMVVLTMIIERMSIIWEEIGPYESIKQGLQTLMISVLVYGVINIKDVRFITFTYPETLLIVVGVIMILGRYTGYRLTELIRFKSLHK